MVSQAKATQKLCPDNIRDFLLFAPESRDDGVENAAFNSSVPFTRFLSLCNELRSKHLWISPESNDNNIVSSKWQKIKCCWSIYL